ncbi:MAG: Na/Pi cotransporter family protein [Syntrophobacterales bacterium]|nr:Na/Pi cotransporter family protein [Syntrophobacterales bacterium]
MFQNVMIFSTGIILFLFGMLKLSKTVQQNFTNIRIREYFSLSVKKPVYGIVTGIISTILFQSSSATTALTVGLVSAGLISFYHSLGIILGSDIGTALTVQLVVWKVTDISPLLIIIGSAVWLGGRGKWRSAGEAVFFFGFMFFGLLLVSQATGPLKASPAFVSFCQELRNPFLGVFIGFILTAIIQSSAIPIATLAILAQHSLVTIDGSLPIILGSNLGTSATALFAGIVANIDGKRCAVSHFLFKFFGVVFFMAILPFFIRFLEGITQDIPQQIAYAHFFFNLALAIVFSPFLGPFSRFIERVMPGKGESISMWPEFLDERLLLQTETALNCARKELQREIMLAQKMFTKAIGLIRDFRERNRNDINYIELVVDNLQREIGNYLYKISRGPVSPEMFKRLFLFSSMVDDIERMADHAVNISELSERKHRREIVFSEAAMEDLKVIEDLVTRNIEDAVAMIDRDDREIISWIIQREQKINLEVKEARERHLERYCKELCHAEAGPIFVEMLMNLERISDHCENIAEYFQDMEDT